MRPTYPHGPQILDLLRRSVAEASREARRVKKEINKSLFLQPRGGKGT